MDTNLENWRNVIFAVDAVPLTPAQNQRLRDLNCDYVVLNVRNGRAMIDMIGPVHNLLLIEDRLTEAGRNPVRIAVWDADGVMHGQPNKQAYMSVARDVKTYDPETGTVLTSTRPTAYIDIHRWAGWAEKDIP